MNSCAPEGSAVPDPSASLVFDTGEFIQIHGNQFSFFEETMHFHAYLSKFVDLHREHKVNLQKNDI